MKELLLVCVLAAAVLFGYFEFKKLGAFLENNREQIDRSLKKRRRKP